eukprot:SM000020S06007  [mRNA]  locus=s20:400496:404218:+ [translate_table: standard]
MASATLLVAAALFACLLGDAAAAASVGSSGGPHQTATGDPEIDVKDPGLFYVFGDGQIIAIDAAQGVVAKNIATSNLTFPNSCANNQYNGVWGDLTTSASNTIFASADYATDGAVFVIDTTQQTVAATVALPGLPFHLYYVDYLQQIWSHSDTGGGFDVINVQPPYNLVSGAVLNDTEKLPGHGSLLFDIPSQPNIGYVTDVFQSGVYELNLLQDDTGAANNRVTFVDFSTVTAVQNMTIVCPGTHDIRYSQVAGRVFVACTSEGVSNYTGPNPGTVEFNPDNNVITNFYNFLGENLYITPDQSYLLSVSPDDNVIHTLHFTAGSVFNYIPIAVNGSPDSAAFYPTTSATGKSSYMAYVSLVNGPGMVAIDLAAVFSCGATCPAGTLANYITVIPMGQQNRLGANGYNSPGDANYNSISEDRPLAGGAVAICTLAAFENNVYCYNVNTKATQKYSVPNPQLIVFTPGLLNGTDPAAGTVNTTFSCDTLNGGGPSPSGAHPSVHAAGLLLSLSILAVMSWSL